MIYARCARTRGIVHAAGFPEPPADRPYVFINMASTVDGKIVVGKPGGTAKGVGGPTDQRLFRRLQKRADAALLGSATLRASNVLYPPEIPRFVVSRSGDVPLQNRFFTDAPESRLGVGSRRHRPGNEDTSRGVRQYTGGRERGVDLKAAMRVLRQEQGIRYLLCEGGATLNDELIRSGLADELFLTLAPKLKGGAHLPTIMTGQGFAPNSRFALAICTRCIMTVTNCTCATVWTPRRSRRPEMLFSLAS